MAVFKCKMCGGTLDIDINDSVGVCEYCGTKQTLPRLDNEKRANLYDRASHFRQINDYDAARVLYEQVLSEDKTDAEAYWSVVLCRYGIEYVEDPVTHKRIPTVNRAQYTSIFNDSDYKSALQYADPFQIEIYEQEAKAIDEIQKGILDISKNESPFDIFICYKESDDNGRRTIDSVLAYDVYKELVGAGYKVFFSRITLEDKVGTAYEPYIFAALNSAPIMLVIGTRKEFFEAVWVKNEWSRFLGLINSGARKTLIPMYKDMSPYDLPEEFAHLQAQDMNNLGYLQDLLRGINKLIGNDEAQVIVKETVVSGYSANVDALLKRGYIALEDCEWEKADAFFEDVLNQDAECAQAYLGKLMVEMKASIRDALVDCQSSFEGNSNYQKAVRFGDEELSNTLKGYLENINERNRNKYLNDIYEEAATLMKRAESLSNGESRYRSAAEKFRSVSGYKDADQLAEICERKAEENHVEAVYSSAKKKIENGKLEEVESAIEELRTIPGYKDADALVVTGVDKLETLKEKYEEERIERERNTARAINRRKLIIALSSVVLIGIIIAVVILINSKKPVNDNVGDGGSGEMDQTPEEIDYGQLENEVIGVCAGSDKAAIVDFINSKKAELSEDDFEIICYFVAKELVDTNGVDFAKDLFESINLPESADAMVSTTIDVENIGEKVNLSKLYGKVKTIDNVVIRNDMLSHEEIKFVQDLEGLSFSSYGLTTSIEDGVVKKTDSHNNTVKDYNIYYYNGYVVSLENGAQLLDVNRCSTIKPSTYSIQIGNSHYSKNAISTKSSYKVIIEDVTWKEAEKKARDMGGHLLHINDEYEMDTIVAKLDNASYVPVCFFIGGMRLRSDTHSQYFWTDNRDEVDNSLYSNYWMGGWPENSANNNGYYMCLIYSEDEKRWMMSGTSNDLINKTGQEMGHVGYIVEFEEIE